MIEEEVLPPRQSFLDNSLNRVLESILAPLYMNKVYWRGFS